MKRIQMPADPELPSKKRQRLVARRVDECLGNKDLSHRPVNTICRDQDDLCSRCSCINLEQLFVNSSKQHEWKVMDLGKLGAEAETSRCPLCRLFHAVRIHEDDSSASDDFNLYAMMTPNPNCSATGTVLAVAKQPNTRLNLARRSDWSQSQFIAASTAPKSGQRDLLRARSIESDSIDFNILRGWLQICEVQHCEQCTELPTSRLKLSALKLIDCEQRRIIPALPCHKYSALSYVWGKKTSEIVEWSVDTILPCSLPRVIEDALNVTQQLGLRYMWIDRYCINQNDEGDVHTQIRQMGIIYQNATVTLVAAAGTDPSFGLPGVGATSRVPQAKARVGDLCLVSILADPKPRIQDSEWAHRAWTYQEAFFSRRCLIFTEQQVYFECRGGLAREAVEAFQKSQLSQLFKGNKWGKHYARDICYHIEAESGRELSMEADAIRTTEGILHSLGGTDLPVRHHFGVPILAPTAGVVSGASQSTPRSKAEGFAVGLSWSHCAAATRRSLFPSWSWAGWSARIRYYGSIYSHTSTIEEESQLKVFIEHEDASLSDMDLMNDFDLDLAGLGEISGLIHIDAWTIPIKLQYMPVGASDWIRWFKTEETSDHNMSGFFAVFERVGEVIQAPVYLLSHESEDIGPERQNSAPFINGDEMLGVILGRCEDFLWSAWNEGIFVMIVQKKGQLFERVGHLRLRYRMLRFTLDNSNWQDYRAIRAGHVDLHQFWHTCLRFRERKRISMV